MSTANCLVAAPGVFDLDADGIATVIGTGGNSAAVEEAVAECPVSALRLLRP
jgi:ferredoxin